MKREVVVTGIGLLTSLGEEPYEVFRRICQGDSGIVPVQFPEPTAVTIAGKIQHFDPLRYIPGSIDRSIDQVIRYGLYAAHKAMEDAQLHDFDPTRAGVIMGVGQAELRKDEGRMTPFSLTKTLLSTLVGHISMAFHLQSHVFAISNACASSANAIGEALRKIQYNEADIMVCGGAEAPIAAWTMNAFSVMKALSLRNENPQEASRPFDVTRDGFVLSEGAAVLVLEEKTHAQQRNARIYAELKGYGVSGDAYKMTLPPPDGRGAKLSMNRALQDAVIEAAEVDYISAHATSTPAGDEIELAAIESIFSHDVKVSATKSSTGHLLGAAGALAAALTVMALAQGTLPPTLNLRQSIPTRLDLLPQRALSQKIHTAMVNAFAFGGSNASLVFVGA